jgi:hypothetical protein
MAKRKLEARRPAREAAAAPANVTHPSTPAASLHVDQATSKKSNKNSSTDPEFDEFTAYLSGTKPEPQGEEDPGGLSIGIDITIG